MREKVIKEMTKAFTSFLSHRRISNVVQTGRQDQLLTVVKKSSSSDDIGEGKSNF